MVQQAFPTLNGVAVSWADLNMNLSAYGGGSVSWPDPKDITYDQTITRGEQKGPGGDVIARSRGSRAYTASMTMYLSGWDKWLQELMAVAESEGKKIGAEILVGNVAFDILLQFTPLGTSKIHKIKLKGCCVDGDSASHSEGDEVEVVAVTLSPTKIVRIINGKEVRL